MRFDVLTLFPEMFQGFLNTSIIKKAYEKGLVETSVINFRDFSTDKHRTVDDTPYGGGGGMVLKPEPIFEAVDYLVQDLPVRPPVLLMSPQGEPFTQQKAEELARYSHLIILCGHYEGYDERIREHVATEEISIGDYVLTGGELPAMVVIDSVSRLIPGVLGNENSATLDSFSSGLLEYPQYTRPAEYRGYRVPDVLLSGHHLRIEQWRRRQALRRTWERRPDLLQTAPLTEEDRAYLRELERDFDRDE
ncbi:tRNA (guanosine(37)-N1)-methyltransferase TrmD [Paenactinomyces guangxiensis]|uniref:tRNA (guanine-N(1)-)-methyltransferase n=1 Tax=Paenactinomyces guangxiensis TaxID=1490290 RepID=A0A7W1WRF8_9BACL|nr:tRNA (guanosine(37)-N1)-methyltransferase TrmD [Paenactinomyces guangxiensis]MBA4494712.1 tRNA (guanosine(37)-N1)-methyltransferase TrmD [Paenactinomyces guangxiensis]MBH8591796.1 tRNA (guanosine(37)-N1)-methyltransferase TrmD [Paenactinomyces guangxiensis]